MESNTSKKWYGEGGNKDGQQSEDRQKVSCLNRFIGTKQGLGNNSLWKIWSGSELEQGHPATKQSDFNLGNKNVIW